MSETLPVSVIIPSALGAMSSGKLWLERAIASVRAQTKLPREVLLAVDPGVELPEHIVTIAEIRACNFRWIRGESPGHQSAMNAAVLRALYPTVAFLEDDDEWLPGHLELLYALSLTPEPIMPAFASASQELVDPEGNSLGQVFDYPTASGWLMSRHLWVACGGVDARWNIHHDNEFIGRLNASKVSRIHIVEKGAEVANRPQLQLIARHARIIKGRDCPTVRRTVHPQSIMGGVSTNPERQRRSAIEYAACEVLYGGLENTW